MKKICCICGEVKDINIVIKGRMICSDCEWKIVKSNVCEKGYDDIVKRISQSVKMECTQ